VVWIRVFLLDCALVSAFMAMAVWSVPAWASGGASPQEMLDLLAKPASASGPMLKITALPSHFAEWTDAQKQSGFQQIFQYCALVNALEHDNPKSQILPTSMTKQEEAQLAISVCLPAKMPVDWPDRRKYLDVAQRLIVKARSYGSQLQIPANLKTD
jgi:hypothetical protein